MQTKQFIPGYMKAGYGYYDEYLSSDEWANTKDLIRTLYPKSIYCWICDATTYLDLHHENYDAIPNEQFLKDVVWLCRNCHSTVHRLDTGARTPLTVRHLRLRRRQLRTEHIRRSLRASTAFYFTWRWLYRLMW